MDLGLLYPVLCAPLFMLALVAWARWARSGGARWCWLGTLACAAAIDAGRSLLERLDDNPGGISSRWVLTALVGCAGALVVQTWSRLARDDAPDGQGPVQD